MRLFFCYVVVILIALQSMNTISAMNDSHEGTQESSILKSNTHTYQGKHQDSDHHSDEELLAFESQSLDGKSAHSDADHPDCHSNHCHHGNLIYLDLFYQVRLIAITDIQVIGKTDLFKSLPTSPSYRPPIV